MMEFPSIYRALRHDAKNWWYHAQLRRLGDTKKARELEHKSLRNNIKDLREAMLHGRAYQRIEDDMPTMIVVNNETTLSNLHPGMAWAASKLLKVFTTV